VGSQKESDGHMRYEKGHKATTRGRILEEASRRFREEGIAAVGVANLMSGIGLTQGGFYNHFESKDELAREALMSSGSGTLQRLAEEKDLAGIVAWYLSPSHRDDPGRGCPIAALAPEVARGSDQLRTSFTGELDGTLALLRGCLPKGLTTSVRKSVAMSMFASMVGTLVLARAVNDPATSGQLLAAGKKAAMAMVPLSS
jgi:TetR/AcrR family transcriptional repressor of nem operon